MPKNARTTAQFVLISHASKVTLKSLSSQASTIREPRTSRCTTWVSKRQRNQRSNCQQPLDHRKSKGISEKTSTSASLTMLKPLTFHNNMWKILKEMGKPDHPTGLLWNLCVGQEATVRTNRTWKNELVPNWERSMSRLYTVTSLFNFYAEHIMQNAGLDEA